MKLQRKKDKMNRKELNNTVWKLNSIIRNRLKEEELRDLIIKFLFYNYAYENPCEDWNVPKGWDYKNYKEMYDSISYNQDLEWVFTPIDLSKHEDSEFILKSLTECLFGIKDYEGDLFGDIYEFTMEMYATKAGKSGGEFYTPSCMSRLLTRLMDLKNINKAYDPTCGTGALLLKPQAKEYWGQDINPNSIEYCKINMIMRGIPLKNIHLEKGNTLSNPAFMDTKFDCIVSNPPFSISWNQITDDRFIKCPALAPKSKADLAFVLHTLHYLAEEGTAGLIMFAGILYRSGAEAKIREYLIENNYIEAVIQLPDDVFFGTSIGTIILILKKNKVNKDVYFMNASTQFVKDSNIKKNTINEENIKYIVEHYKDISVPYEKIKENNYTLSVNTYIKEENKEEKIDIEALELEIEQICERQNTLRQEICKIIMELKGKPITKDKKRKNSKRKKK